MLRRNGPWKTQDINPPESIPGDKSGPISSETTIFIEVGLVMSGSRSQLRGVTNRVLFQRRDV